MQPKIALLYDREVKPPKTENGEKGKADHDHTINHHQSIALMQRIFTQTFNRHKVSILAVTEGKQLPAHSKTGLTVAAGSLTRVNPSLSGAVRARSYSTGRDTNERYKPESETTRNVIREAYSGSAGKGYRNSRATSGYLQRSGTFGNSASSLPGSLIGGSHSRAFSASASARGETSHWYITIKEDFDIIPLISYFAQRNFKCACFISHCKTTMPYQPIFSNMLNRHVERLGNSASSPSVATRKMATLGPQLVLLRGDGMVPPDLSEASVEAIVHWGLPRTGYFASQLKSPKAQNTYLLLTEDEHSAVTDPLVTDNGVREYPESAKLNKSGSQSPLYSLRNRALRILPKMELETLNKVYEGQFDRPNDDPIELAKRANKFAARVLLRGNPEDGSPAYKPTGPRLSVPKSLVQLRNLQPALDQGLIQVRE